MLIKEVIQQLQKEGTWIDWQNHTRDRVLCGDIEQEITSIGVCWVATMKVIETAIEKGMNVIITHENPFYTSGTNVKTSVFEAQKRKLALLNEHHITVYRCHDVWDAMPIYGVGVQWAKRLGFAFEEGNTMSCYHAANIAPCKVKDLAKQIATVVQIDGEQGVYVFGDMEKEVQRLAIGVGAATDVHDMLRLHPDVVLVSDDGITNYNDAQFALDMDLPMIVVNHAGCEICGMKAMPQYFHEVFPELDCQYVEEGFQISYITSSH